MHYLLLTYLIVLYGAGLVRTDAGKSICRNATIDAAIATPLDKIVYLFQGDNFWTIQTPSPTAHIYKYPQKISSKWTGVDGPIDAALSVKRRGLYRMYLFFGKKYARYTIIHNWGQMKTKYNPDEGYPKRLGLRRNFRGIPRYLDAAFVWKGNGRGYFFKGNNFWAYNWTNSRVEKKHTYPRDISVWGIPPDIDAAVTHPNGYTYFFKGDVHWKFDNKKFKVVQSRSRPYPRKTASTFFGCPYMQSKGDKPSEEESEPEGTPSTK